MTTTAHAARTERVTPSLSRAETRQRKAAANRRDRKAARQALR